MSVCASYCYRVAFPVVTERLPTINFFWPVNISVDRGSLRYEELFLAYLCRRNVGKHCSKWWSVVLIVVGMVLLAEYTLLPPCVV